MRTTSTSDVVHFDYALQEPALSTAPVFLVQQKGKRKKLDVTRTFDDVKMRWRGPDALGMPEQSVLLGLLSIAGQQPYLLCPQHTQETGNQLLALLTLGKRHIASDLAVVQASWNKLAAAAGYQSSGGRYTALVKEALKRLTETTVWEGRQGMMEHPSRLLAWIDGNHDGVIIVLNKRATDALQGGQFVKISLVERNALPDESSKALHAWLSGHLRAGSSRVYAINKLQMHVWGGEASGSTLRTRLGKLRDALTNIGSLPGWRCRLSSDGHVEVRRNPVRTITDKIENYRRAPGTIADSGKTPLSKEKGNAE
jgi:hypothetical protein